MGQSRVELLSVWLQRLVAAQHSVVSTLHHRTHCEFLKFTANFIVILYKEISVNSELFSIISVSFHDSIVLCFSFREGNSPLNKWFGSFI